MSRNNLIIVILLEKLWHVLVDMNADTEWSTEACKDCATRGTTRVFKTRASALVYAHNKQRLLNTEYGVREIWVNKPSYKRKRKLFSESSADWTFM